MARHTTSRGAATAVLVLGLTGVAPAVAAPWSTPAPAGGDAAAPGLSGNHGEMDHGEMDHGETVPQGDGHSDHGETVPQGDGHSDHGETDHGETDHGETVPQGEGHGDHGAGTGGQQAGGGHEDHGSRVEQGGHGGDPDSVSARTRQLVLSGFGAANAAVVAGALLLRRHDRRAGRPARESRRAQR